MKNLVNIFAVENDTNQFAVVLDNRFQFFLTQAEVDAVEAEIFSRSNGSKRIDDTAFGALEILPPYTGNGQKLSECEQTDLHQYIKDTRTELERRVREDAKVRGPVDTEAWEMFS